MNVPCSLAKGPFSSLGRVRGDSTTFVWRGLECFPPLLLVELSRRRRQDIWGAVGNATPEVFAALIVRSAGFSQRFPVMLHRMTSTISAHPMLTSPLSTTIMEGGDASNPFRPRSLADDLAVGPFQSTPATQSQQIWW